FSTLLSKANIVHDIGVLDHCNSVAPAMVVLANEMIDQLEAYTKGVVVSEETMAMDVIKQVGHGGHYLNEMHTLSNFKSVWYPKFFNRPMVNADESTIMDEVIAKIDDILDNHVVAPLDAAILQQLNTIEEKYN
ncbi:MAG: trimethylamine methyltransferase family protein, partial [Eubacterium sp.]